MMKNKLKPFVILVAIAALAILFAGCGQMEKAAEEMNYETLVGKTGDLHLISGGEIYKTFDNVTITYSNSDSEAIYYETEDGDERYWQGQADFDIK